MFKLYVGNLSWTVTDEELKFFFSEVGNIKKATVVMDRETGRSRGFGFVELESQEELNKALELNGKTFAGREVLVRKALPEGTKRVCPHCGGEI